MKRKAKYHLGLVVLVFAAVLAGCAADVAEQSADGEFDTFVVDGAADAWGVTEGSVEVLGVLRVANELTQRELDRLIDRRAAQNIMEARAGADGMVGTADDVP